MNVSETDIVSNALFSGQADILWQIDLQDRPPINLNKLPVDYY